MKTGASPSTAITVEIIAAWPKQTVRQKLVVAQGTSIHDLRHDPRLAPALIAAWHEAKGVGVFGEKKPLRGPLADGDRVELWRGLLADPKDARRERAKAAALVNQSARKQAAKPSPK